MWGILCAIACAHVQPAASATDGVATTVATSAPSNSLHSTTAPTAAQSSALPLQFGLEQEDVVLHEGGVLVGQVLNKAGHGVPHTHVQLRSSADDARSLRTDASGRFIASGLHGGSVLVSAAGVSRICRLWTSEKAPPSATAALTLVKQDSVVRGQSIDGRDFAGKAYGGRPVLEWMRRHPGLTLGTVTAAVAIPLAIALEDDGEPVPSTP